MSSSSDTDGSNCYYRDSVGSIGYTNTDGSMASYLGNEDDQREGSIASITNRVSPKRKRGLDYIMHKFEKNNHIAEKDITTLLRHLHLPEMPPQILRREMKAAGAEADDTTSGGSCRFLTLKSFFCFVCNQIREVNSGQVEEAFKYFDDQGSSTVGGIPTMEFRKIMTHFGDVFTDQETDSMIRIVDADGDGAINFMEFDDLIIKKLHDFVEI